MQPVKDEVLTSMPPVTPVVAKESLPAIGGELATSDGSISIVFKPGVKPVEKTMGKIEAFMDKYATIVFFAIGTTVSAYFSPVAFAVGSALGAVLQRNYGSILNRFDRPDRKVTIANASLALVGAICALFNAINPEMSVATKMTTGIGGVAFGMFAYSTYVKYMAMKATVKS